MAYPQTYVNLLDRLSRRGCPVCGLLHDDEYHYLDSLLYEYVNDPGVQQSLRRGRGLCNHHSWLLTHHYGYCLGVSILFEAVLDELINIVDTEDSAFRSSVVGGWFGGKVDSKLAEKLEPEIACLACASLSKSETQYIETFAAYWSDAALQSAYQPSDGLCLPHFRDVLRHLPEPKARTQLLELQRGKWAALKAELNQFQLKSAFNYVGEAIGAEADSWRRAVANVTGGEHMFLNLTHPR